MNPQEKQEALERAAVVLRATRGAMELLEETGWPTSPLSELVYLADQEYTVIPLGEPLSSWPQYINDCYREMEGLELGITEAHILLGLHLGWLVFQVVIWDSPEDK